MLVKASHYTQTVKVKEELDLDIKKSTSELDTFRTYQGRYDSLKEKVAKFEDNRKQVGALQIQKENILLQIHEKETIDSNIKKNEDLKQVSKNQYENQIQGIIHDIDGKKNRLNKLSISMNKEEAFATLKDIGKLGERLDRISKVEIPLAKEYDDLKKLDEFQKLMDQAHQKLDIVFFFKIWKTRISCILI